MSIGYFGKDIVFETSSDKILTFTDLKHSTSIVIEQHKIIGKKPLSEYCGQELDSVSFSINLNASLGVSPRNTIEKLTQICKNGEAEELVIGGKILGIDKFLLKEISTAYDVVYNNGFLFSAKVDLTLEEYISDTSLNKSTISTSSQTGGYYNLTSKTSSSNILNKFSQNYGINDSAAAPFLGEIVEGLHQ